MLEPARVREPVECHGCVGALSAARAARQHGQPCERIAIHGATRSCGLLWNSYLAARSEVAPRQIPSAGHPLSHHGKSFRCTRPTPALRGGCREKGVLSGGVKTMLVCVRDSSSVIVSRCFC